MNNCTWPFGEQTPELQPVRASDFEALLTLRMAALRPSLEALGRFDPSRARERFAAGFAPEWMQHIVWGGQRVGLLTLRSVADALVLDHLYVEPQAQGQGLGAWALAWVKAQADIRQVPVSLSALRESAANRFYQRHGFVEVGRSEFDIDYRRLPAAHREAAPAWRRPERYAGISVQAPWSPE